MTVEELLKVSDDDIHYVFIAASRNIRIRFAQHEYREKGIGYFFPTHGICEVVSIKQDSEMKGIPGWLEVQFKINFEGDN